MSKRDDLIRLHKTAVEASQELERSLQKGLVNQQGKLYQAWRNAENAFMRVAEKVTNE